ncbi:MAG TPA: hypothetical protein V6D50_12270 [Chroococcales cyanobacterium]|jgi:hypothetical protein
MVERPIKKSERQTLAPKSDAGEEVKGQGRSTEERFDSKPSQTFQKKDRKKGRGKGKQEDSRPSSVNPALVRAPKPPKPKPPVLEETPDATNEDSVTESTEEATTEE